MNTDENLCEAFVAQKVGDFVYEQNSEAKKGNDSESLARQNNVLSVTVVEPKKYIAPPKFGHHIKHLSSLSQTMGSDDAQQLRDASKMESARSNQSNKARQQQVSKMSHQSNRLDTTTRSSVQSSLHQPLKALSPI